ncbi:MAG: ABC transporter permease [Clostridia bacterium]|nr:ABC transporter permease [Clostridia bacterium]
MGFFTESVLVTFFSGAIAYGMMLLLGSTGEIITEKAGHLNLGIPGIMYVGGICGVTGSFIYERVVEEMNPAVAIIITLLSALLGSLIMGLIYSFLTVTLRANQNVTGLALTTFGTGIANFLGGWLVTLGGGSETTVNIGKVSGFYTTPIAGYDKLGWFGKIFFGKGILPYVVILIALVAAYVLKHTRVGLNLRAVGENPATADAAGINVNKYKYVATCIGSMIAGLGGFYYAIETVNWSHGGMGDIGWLAIALVIFATWRPDMGILGSLLFGALYRLPIDFSAKLGGGYREFYYMLPYVVTIIVLIITSIREKRESQPPASLGLSYFREER